MKILLTIMLIILSLVSYPQRIDKTKIHVRGDSESEYKNSTTLLTKENYNETVETLADAIRETGRFIRLDEYATGDGTTDDQSAVNTAISEATSTGVPLLVSEGVYNLNDKAITFPDKVIFLGGYFKNGTVSGSSTKIVAQKEKIFHPDITISGTWDIDECYFQWFRGSNGTTNSDYEDNWDVLKQLINFNTKIIVDGEWEIKQRTGTDIFTFPNELLWMEGVSKESSKLILSSAHSISYRSYIHSNTGFNVRIKNLTLSTASYEDGSYNVDNSSVFLKAAYNVTEYPDVKVNFDFFEVEKCNIRGQFSFIYTNSEDNTTADEFNALRINRVSVSDNDFHEAHSNFRFLTQGMGDTYFDRNKMLNIYGPPLSISGGTDSTSYRVYQRFISFQDNVVENQDTVNQEFYLTPCILKAERGIIARNYIKNLLNTNTGDQSETYPFYFTSAEETFKVFDNTVIDVVGRTIRQSDAALFKIKGAKHIEAYNNKFVLTRTALVSIGVLDSVDQDISAIESDLFRMAPIGCNVNVGTGNQIVDELARRTYNWQANIHDNVFISPIFNDYTYMNYHSVRFVNNKIYTEHWNDHDDTDWGGTADVKDQLLFYWRSFSDRDDFIFKDNIITAENTQGTKFTIIDGSYSNIKYMDIANNTFNFDGDIIYPGKYLGGKYNLEAKHLSGGIGIEYPDAGNDESISTVFLKMESISNTANKAILFHPRFFGKAYYSVEQNSTDTVTIFKSTLGDYTYLSNEFPFVISIRIIFEDLTNDRTELIFTMVQTVAHSIAYWDSDTDQEDTFDPRDDGEDDVIINIHPSNVSSAHSNVKLRHIAQSDRSAELEIVGLDKTLKFDIEIDQRSLTVPSGYTQSEYITALVTPPN